MTTTLEALKAVYTALGGELTDTYDDIADGAVVGNYATNPDVINAISKVATPNPLPAVESTDAGKVLTVDSDGEWVADSIPSQLPAVTADDNGKVLKVADGAWGIGTDLTE